VIAPYMFCCVSILEVTLFGLRLPRAQSPFHGISQLPERLPILHRQLYNEGTLISSPYIAGDATTQTITAMIDLNEWRTAAVAASGHQLQSSPINVLREIV
jgi:hypothetical protein